MTDTHDLNGMTRRVDSALRALSCCATGATVHLFNNRRCAIIVLRDMYLEENDSETRAEIAAELDEAVRSGMEAIAAAVYRRKSA